MIVDIRGAQREQRGSSAPQQQLGQHEQQHRPRGRRRSLDAVIPQKIIMRRQRWRRQSRGQSPQTYILLVHGHYAAHILVRVVGQHDPIVFFGDEVRNHENQRPDSHYDRSDSDPHGDMPPASKITHEDHRDHVADLVRRRYQPREAGWYLESLLDRSYHRIYITRAQRLLQCNEE